MRNRQLVLVLAMLLAALGIWATLNIPIDAIPDISDVQVVIRTEYPGQAPQIVEDQVTYPLATAMLAVPGARCAWWSHVPPSRPAQRRFRYPTWASDRLICP